MGRRGQSPKIDTIGAWKEWLRTLQARGFSLLFDFYQTLWTCWLGCICTLVYRNKNNIATSPLICIDLQKPVSTLARRETWRVCLILCSVERESQRKPASALTSKLQGRWDFDLQHKVGYASAAVVIDHPSLSAQPFSFGIANFPRAAAPKRISIDALSCRSAINLTMMVRQNSRLETVLRIVKKKQKKEYLFS